MTTLAKRIAFLLSLFTFYSSFAPCARAQTQATTFYLAITNIPVSGATNALSTQTTNALWWNWSTNPAAITDVLIGASTNVCATNLLYWLVTNAPAGGWSYRGITNGATVVVTVPGPVTNVFTGTWASQTFGTNGGAAPIVYGVHQFPDGTRLASTTVIASAIGPTATPTFSLSGSAGNQVITILESTPNTTVYFTTNGTTPSVASAVYSGPFGWGTNGTVKAIANQAFLGSSSVGSFTTATIYFGSLATQPLNATQIQALGATGGQQAAVSQGTYAMTPANQFCYWWFPTSIAAPNAAPLGFSLSGFPVDLAGSAAGFTGSTNGWTCLPVTVGGVTGNLFGTLNLLNGSFTVLIQ